MLIRIFALVLFATAAHGQQPMTGPEFRAFAEGWTLHFEDEAGNYFGSEQYYDNGQTVWLPRGGACLRGVWAPVQDRICFLYGEGAPACWRLYVEGSQLRAENADEGREGETRLRLTRRDQRPIICADGPGV